MGIHIPICINMFLFNIGKNLPFISFTYKKVVKLWKTDFNRVVRVDFWYKKMKPNVGR